MMKKQNIGVLTFQNTNNYGACLQAVALYKILERFGSNVEIIDYHNKRIDINEVPPVITVKYLLNLKNMKRLLTCHRGLKKRFQGLREYMKLNCNISTSIYESDQAYKVLQKYDKVFVGSDQVWGMNITNNDMFYFAEFDNRDKLATKFYTYAVSAGKPWSKIQNEMVKKAIDNFRNLYVRELSLKERLRELTDREIQVVLDPTLLLDYKFWSSDIISHEVKEKYVLIYMESEKIINKAIEFARSKGYTVKVLNFYKKIKGVDNVKPITMMEFLQLIYNAEMVFTASFHGVCMSLNLHSNFVCDNYRNPERIRGLLELLKLEDRSEVENVENLAEINWEKVDEHLAMIREESLKLLESCLND